MPPKNPQACWICGKEVASQDRGIDELGFMVHADCLRKRIEQEQKQLADRIARVSATTPKR